MDDKLFEEKVKKGLSFLRESPPKNPLARLGDAVSYFFSSLGGMIGNLPVFKTPFFTMIREVFFIKALLVCIVVMLAGFFLYKFAIHKNTKHKDTTLFFAQSWEDELEGDVLSKLVGEFQAENPGIIIRMEKYHWDEIRELLDGEDPPDVFSVDPYAIYELESLSLLAPVTENKDPATGAEAPGEEKNAEENSGEEKSAKENGGEKWYGNVVQLISFINPLYYNIDLLRNAGFDRPPKNQTEFLSYVRRIKETSSQYGAGLALSGDYQNINRHILSWIWASAYNPESMEGFKFTGKEVTGTLTFLNQLKQNLYPSPFELSQAQLLEAFGEGKVGMIISSSADIRKLKLTGVNFGITTIPSSESYTKKSVFPLIGWYAGINAKSPFREEARLFASFLKKKAGDLAAAAYAIPGNGQRSRDQSRDDSFYAKAFDMYEASEMVRELYEQYDVSALNGIIKREVELMFKDARTPEECAAAIQRGMESWYGTGNK